MPTGIQAYPAGPGPAAPAAFFLNENVAVPQYITTMTSTVNWRNDRYTETQEIPGWDGQGALLIVPDKVAWMGAFVNEGMTFVLTEISVTSGRRLGLRIPYDFVAESQTFTFTIYKLWPQADRGYGMSFYNSSDIMNITDTGTIGQCRWSWEGNVANAVSVPSYPNSFLYANTNSSDVGLSFDGSTVRAYRNVSDASGGSNHDGASVYARLALFSNNLAGVPEHNGGFNIYAGDRSGRCVFSSYGAPFIVPGRGQVGSVNTGLQYPMGLLLNSYGSIYSSAGSDSSQHNRSLIITGSTITTGFGSRMYRGNLPAAQSIITGIQAPFIDARNYFDSAR